MADGLVGVCYAPLGTIKDNVLLYSSIFVLLLIGLVLSFSKEPEYRRVNESQPELLSSQNNSFFGISKLKKIIHFQSKIMLFIICTLTMVVVIHVLFGYTAANEFETLLASVK